MYLYPARRINATGQMPEPAQETTKRTGKAANWWGAVRQRFLQDRARGLTEQKVLHITRTIWCFPDYRLVRVAVEGLEDVEEKTAEQNLREQLQELTEDPDHTYVVCREPLSFYFGREFREYLQQEWIDHLLRYGEKKDGMPLRPDLILLGRNVYLPYVMLRYAAGLRSVKWYLTDREYREDEELLSEELEDEYGLIPEIHLLPENADYGKVRLQGTKPCVVLDFCDNGKVYGGGLAAGSIWLDFPASEKKEHRVASGCPQIRYFSMKKEWKDPRKALEYLDTISKNGYNNSVD